MVSSLSRLMTGNILNGACNDGKTNLCRYIKFKFVKDTLSVSLSLSLSFSFSLSLSLSLFRLSLLFILLFWVYTFVFFCLFIDLFVY